MRALLVVFLVGALGYWAVGSFVRYQSNKSKYSLSTIETRPVPQKEFFELWTDVALNGCTDARTRRYISTEDCKRKVNERSAACAASTSRKAPARIGDKTLSRELARTYLLCVTPWPTCKGIEVKSEDDARRYCG